MLVRVLKRRPWIAAAALVATAAILSPCLRVACPRLAVAAVANEHAGYIVHGLVDRNGWSKGRSFATDPWGHAIIVRVHLSLPTVFYSVGPNGVDEDGAGDDVVPSESELAIGRWLDAAPGLLVAMAVLIVWCGHGPYAHAPRSASVAFELGRSTVLASVPTVVLVVVTLVVAVLR
jgi:hypothetical protein